MPPAPSPIRSRAFELWLVLSLLVANLMVLGVTAWAIRASLQRHRQQAEVTTRNLAAILEENLAGRIRLLDLTLLQALEDPRLTACSSPAAYQALLEPHRARVPHLAALRITDAEGRVIGGTLVEEARTSTIADRPYFQALKDQPAGGLVLSPPVVSRFDQTLVLIFARARRDSAGRFAGILYGVLPLDIFTQALGMVDIGPQGSIALRDGAHQLITRYPLHPDTPSRLGERVRTPEYLEIVRSQRGLGTFRKASPVDGRMRTWTVRRVSGQPLWLVVGLAESDYLVTWRQERLKAGATLVGSLLLTSLLGGLVLRNWRRQVLAQQERESAIEALTLALAEVKELKGLLPICSACKKIRDDQGYWNQMETYISRHTDATFTHGLCPGCIQEYFPRGAGGSGGRE